VDFKDFLKKKSFGLSGGGRKTMNEPLIISITVKCLKCGKKQEIRRKNLWLQCDCGATLLRPNITNLTAKLTSQAKILRKITCSAKKSLIPVNELAFL
jgi:hypothetical protein